MEFNPGDYIWLYTTNLQLPPILSCKLAALWIGPYEVTGKSSAIAFHLHLPPELAIHYVYYTSLLKPHHGPIPSCPAPIIVADIGATKYKV